MNKFAKINAFLEQNNFGPLSAEHEHLIDCLYDIYFSGRIIESDNEVILNAIGKRHYINRKYSEAKKYYLIALEKGSIEAMFNLGLYYEHCSNHDMMLKYYKMAAEHGESQSMFRIGFHYEYRDRDMMEKYYEMAIENGNSMAMFMMGKHYEFSNKYDMMKKYYTMAIEKGNTRAMVYLGSYEEGVMPGSGLKYFEMAIERDESYAAVKIGNYYKDQKQYDKMEKYYVKAIEMGLFADNMIVIDLVAYYERNERYDDAIKYCVSGIKKHKGSAMTLAIKKYLTDEHISIVIKYLIEFDLNIRDLIIDGCVEVNNKYVTLYNAVKENKITQQLKQHQYEDVRKEFGALCHIFGD